MPIDPLHPSIELPGLSVTLDNLVHRYEPQQAPADRPHLFIYFLTIHNHSDRRVTLLARKWVVQRPDGETEVIEGDRIVGQTPSLAPGETFSYNSFHLTGTDAAVRGAFFGLDEQGHRIHVRIPAFDLRVPEAF